MNRQLRILSPAFTAVMLLAVCHLHAAQPAAKSGAGAENQISVTADKLSTADGSNQIEASGNVEIKREDTTLKANELRMNRTTQDVEAKGRVSLDGPEWKVKIGPREAAHIPAYLKMGG